MKYILEISLTRKYSSKAKKQTTTTTTTKAKKQKTKKQRKPQQNQNQKNLGHRFGKGSNNGLNYPFALPSNLELAKQSICSYSRRKKSAGSRHSKGSNIPLAAIFIPSKSYLRPTELE